MNERDIGTITDFMALGLIVEIVVATVCATYVAVIYLKSTRKSRTFRTIARDDVIKVMAGGWIGFLAVFRLVPLPDPAELPTWTAPVSAVVIAVLLWPPIDHALTFRSLRRTRTPPAPPPFTEGD